MRDILSMIMKLNNSQDKDLQDKIYSAMLDCNLVNIDIIIEYKTELAKAIDNKLLDKRIVIDCIDRNNRDRGSLRDFFTHYLFANLVEDTNCYIDYTYISTSNIISALISIYDIYRYKLENEDTAITYNIDHYIDNVINYLKICIDNDIPNVNTLIYDVKDRYIVPDKETMYLYLDKIGVELMKYTLEKMNEYIDKGYTDNFTVIGGLIAGINIDFDYSDEFSDKLLDIFNYFKVTNRQLDLKRLIDSVKTNIEPVFRRNLIGKFYFYNLLKKMGQEYEITFTYADIAGVRLTRNMVCLDKCYTDKLSKEDFEVLYKIYESWVHKCIEKNYDNFMGEFKHYKDCFDSRFVALVMQQVLLRGR